MSITNLVGKFFPTVAYGDLIGTSKNGIKVYRRNELTTSTKNGKLYKQISKTYTDAFDHITQVQNYETGEKMNINVTRSYAYKMKALLYNINPFTVLKSTNITKSSPKTGTVIRELLTKTRV